MRLVFDSGVLRNLIHRHPPVIDAELLGLRCPAVQSSIASTAFVEVVAALQEHRIPWNEWRDAVPSIRRAIDPDMPVLPGRRELVDLVTDQLSVDHIAHIRAGWQHIVEAPFEENLGNLSRYHDSSGTLRGVTADFHSALEIRSRVHQEWIAIIRRMQDIFRNHEVSDQDVEARVRNGFDRIPGRSLDCLDAAVRFLSRYIALSLRQHSVQPSEES